MEGWAQFITSLATLLGVIGSLIAAHRNMKISQANSSKLDIVHAATNGMSTALAASKEKEGRAEGRAEGAEEERTRAEAKATDLLKEGKN